MPSAVVSGRGLSSAAANASRDGEGVPLACQGVGDSKEWSWSEGNPNYLNFADYDCFMIELCTNEDSKLGQVSSASQGCFVLRITVMHDLTTVRGVRYALDGIQAWVRHRRRLKLVIHIIVWISIPCAGGSPWNRLNRLRGKETRERELKPMLPCLKRCLMLPKQLHRVSMK